MDQHLTSLALALGIFAVGFVSIGPNILAIIGTSMERGRRQGVEHVSIHSGASGKTTVEEKTIKKMRPPCTPPFNVENRPQSLNKTCRFFSP